VTGTVIPVGKNVIKEGRDDAGGRSRTILEDEAGGTVSGVGTGS
jgi:hypothetical protein